MRLSWFPTVAAVLAVLGGCPGSDGADETPKEERAFSVAVEVAGSGTVADPVQVTGTIHPKRDVVVAAEGSGRVVDVAVSLGHIVARGAVLATLDSVVQRAQLDQAEAGLREAKAVFALSEAGFKREETLVAGGATTPQEHFRSGVELERAQAGVTPRRLGLLWPSGPWRTRASALLLRAPSRRGRSRSARSWGRGRPRFDSST